MASLSRLAAHVQSPRAVWCPRRCNKAPVLVCAQKVEGSELADPPLAVEASGDGFMLFKQTIAMFAAGAVLGPLCDSQHTSQNVLHYSRPTFLGLGPVGAIETCWWVPLMFGVASVIIGVSVPLLDESAAKGKARNGVIPDPPAPGWFVVNLCIAAFVTQYFLSGYLETPLLGRSLEVSILPASSTEATISALKAPALEAILGTYAVLQWLIFDRTVPGVLMSTLTAVGGPLVEIVLINVLHLYHYEHPDATLGLGVPLWLPAVYFSGATAVALLGRQVWASMKR